MENHIVIRTVIPILFLIVIGYISKRRGILNPGEERVLSTFIYRFALPAQFIINISEITFTQETRKFIFAGISPLILLVITYTLLFFIFKLSKNHLFLLILSTVFGSHAFFGIPFITFAFPTLLGEHLATLSADSMVMETITTISDVISVAVSLIYMKK